MAVPLVLVAQPAPPGGDDPHDVLEEVHEHGGDRADLDDRGEADDGVVVDGDPHQPLGDLEVAGRGDGEEFGHPLDGSEDDGLTDVDDAHGIQF